MDVNRDAYPAHRTPWRVFARRRGKSCSLAREACRPAPGRLRYVPCAPAQILSKFLAHTQAVSARTPRHGTFKQGWRHVAITNGDVPRD